MNDLFLIAHKVCGEPAFDIAERMECPLCIAQGCAECDDEGYWWIIPTSGHRAYPYWHEELRLLIDWPMQNIRGNPLIDEIPLNCPDHYPLRHTPSAPRVDILALLPQEPKATIRRRL